MDNYEIDTSGNVTYYLDGDLVKKIVVPSGTYSKEQCSVGDEYTAEYYYEGQQLLFVFVYKGNEEYRFYMDIETGLCIRYIGADGVVNDYVEGISESEMTEKSVAGQFCSLGELELHWAGIY